MEVVTLQKVAQKAGVAVSTASRALAGRGRISASTRKHVRGIAEEMGYRPDPALARLAAHRWPEEQRAEGDSTLAVITDWEGQLPRWQQRSLHGLRARARGLGYKVEVLCLAELGGCTRRLGEVLRARGTAGAIFLQETRRNAYQGFDWEQLPCTALGLGEEVLPVETVSDDLFGNYRLCWQKLRARGCRRVAALFGFVGRPVAREYAESAVLLEARRDQEAGLPICDSPICCFGDVANEQRLDYLLDFLRQTRPDGVVCPRLGDLHEHLVELGVAPRHMAVSNLFQGQETHLSGTERRTGEAGVMAVNLCHQKIVSRVRQTVRSIHFIESVWREGIPLE